jgi:hypothetical protein
VKTPDGAYIAYQVVGGGLSTSWQFDFWGNIDVWWENPLDRWFESLARMGR